MQYKNKDTKEMNFVLTFGCGIAYVLLITDNNDIRQINNIFTRIKL